MPKFLPIQYNKIINDMLIIEGLNDSYHLQKKKFIRLSYNSINVF